MIFWIGEVTIILLICLLGDEFCAALKIPFPKMKVYERKKKHDKEIGYDGQKYRFKYIKTIPNKVKSNSTLYGGIILVFH